MGDPSKGSVAPAVTIDFVRPSSLSRLAVDDTDPVAVELGFGLWDNAFDTTQKDVLLNGLSEANNFIGSDSQRFYLRVTDPGAKGRKFIEAEWWTAYQAKPDRIAGIIEDDPPSTPVTLFETAPGSGIFTSHALMLINNNADLVVTHSGISSTDPLLGPIEAPKRAGLRRQGQTDYRLRRTGMHHFVVGAYTPRGATKPAATTVKPVFLPANQHFFPLQVYVLRDSTGAPSYPVARVLNIDLPTVTEVYTRIGLWPWTAVSARDPTKLNPGRVTGGPINYTITIVDSPPGVDPAALDETMADILGTAFPMMAPNTLRLFFTKQLNMAFAPQPVGISFGIDPDPAPVSPCTSSSDPAPRQGLCFAEEKSDKYTAAHELGHPLWNKNKMKVEIIVDNTGTSLPKCISDSHWRTSKTTRGPVGLFNLMTSIGANVVAKFPQGVLHPKRLWGNVDDDGTLQEARMLSSRWSRR